jgi:hypothetical protein
MTIIDNLDDAPYSEDELRESLRYSQTIQASQRQAAVEAHGAAVVNAAVPALNTSQPGGSYRYDTFRKAFISSTGEVIPEAELERQVASASIGRVPDDGRDTNYERNRLLGRLQWIKGEYEGTHGFDASGQPIYKHAPAEREKLRVAFEGEKRSIEAAYVELDSLDNQRQIDANARQAQAQQDAERDARIEHEAVLEAERIEIRTRAEAIIAARNKRTAW